MFDINSVIIIIICSPEAKRFPPYSPPVSTRIFLKEKLAALQAACTISASKRST